MAKFSVKVIETRVYETEVEAETERQAHVKFEDYYFEHSSEFDSLLDVHDTDFEYREIY